MTDLGNNEAHADNRYLGGEDHLHAPNTQGRLKSWQGVSFYSQGYHSKVKR